MNTLPVRYVGAPLVVPTTTIQAGITDPILQDAANVLLSDLQTNGPQTSARSSVSAFQKAWNDSGGTTEHPSLTVEGRYGTDTEGALNQALQAGGSGAVAPHAIAVAINPKPVTTPLTVLPATNWLSISSVTTAMSNHPWLTAIFLGTAVLVTYMNWEKKKRRQAGGRRRPRRTTRRRARRMTRRGRGKRQRNPSRKRTTKARIRKSYAVQIKYGTSKRGWKYYSSGSIGSYGWKKIPTFRDRRTAVSLRNMLSAKYGKSRTRVVAV